MSDKTESGISPADLKILRDWNNTQSDFPDVCVHKLFEYQLAAEAKADRIALVHGDRQLTYRELEQRANQLANYLISIGVKAGNLIGIRVERSPEMIIGLLGVLKAGAAYVPIDTADPPSRIEYIISDAAIDVLLTSADKTPSPDDSVSHNIRLDRNWELFSNQSKEF